MKKNTKLIGAFAVGAVLVFAAMGGFSGQKAPAPLAVGGAGTPSLIQPDAAAATPVAGAEKITVGALQSIVKVDGNNSDLGTTAGSIRIWEGSEEPSDSATGNNPILSVVPNTVYGTASKILTNTEYKAVLSGTNLYPVSLWGMSADGKALKGAFPTRATFSADTLTVPVSWPKVRYVATPTDILAENAPSGDTSLNGNTTPNGTIDWTDQGTTSPSTECFAVGQDATPANGDTIYWNNSNCGGSWFIRLNLNSGTRSFTWQYKPALDFSDPNGNRSSTAVSSSTLSLFQAQGGKQYNLGSGSVSLGDIINQNRCLLLYDPADPWIPANVVNTVRWDVTTSTDWAAGQELTVDFVDLAKSMDCDATGWEGVSNATGWPQTNNLMRLRIQRYNSD